MNQVVIPETIPKALEALPQPGNERWPVYLAITAVSVALIGAVVAIILFGGDNTTVFSTLIVSSIPVVTSVLSLVKTQQVSSKVDGVAAKAHEVGVQTVALRIEIDGRFSKVADDMRAIGVAEGQVLGASAQREQTASDTLALAEAKSLLARQTVELDMLRAAIPVAAPAAPVEVTVVPGEPQPVRVVAAVPVPVEVKTPDGG